jgi:hypothetical protein
MNSTALMGELFLCGVYEYREEAFNMMQQLYSGNEIGGGTSPNPTYPNLVSLDLSRPFDELMMYTNNLRDLAAPRELCVQKALELISSRANYELNIASFRMELMQEVLAELGEEDVDALIMGIRCICDHLLSHFDNYTQSNADFFPYEFYCLLHGKYLFLTKIMVDTDPLYIRQSLTVKPAYYYPEVQVCNRATYVSRADQCPVLT